MGGCDWQVVARQDSGSFQLSFRVCSSHPGSWDRQLAPQGSCLGDIFQALSPAALPPVPAQGEHFLWGSLTSGV